MTPTRRRPPVQRTSPSLPQAGLHPGRPGRSAAWRTTVLRPVGRSSPKERASLTRASRRLQADFRKAHGRRRAPKMSCSPNSRPWVRSR